mgnify:FL=1
MDAALGYRVNRTHVRAFGAKIDVRGVPGVSTDSIEADTLLFDGTFIDAKWSKYETPTIKQQQIDNLVAVLRRSDRPIERAVFPVNGSLDDDTIAMIRKANDDLKDLRSIDYDLITMVDDLGTFGRTVT